MILATIWSRVMHTLYIRLFASFILSGVIGFWNIVWQNFNTGIDIRLCDNLPPEEFDSMA